MNEILVLKDYIAKDNFKEVYPCPWDDTKVIKIIKPHHAQADGGFKGQSKLRRSLFQGVYRQFRREIIQYLQLCKTHYGTGKFLFPIETPHGFIHTDKGLGLLVEKITAPDGKCWTLNAIASGPGLEPKHLQALNQFFDDCVRMHVVFARINTDAFLYTENRNGGPEFVLVDGIGDKLFIPIRAMSRRISARHVRNVQRRIMASIGQPMPA